MDSSFEINRWDIADARRNIRDAKAELKELANTIYWMKRPKQVDLQDTARKMNAAIVKLTNAQLKLGERNGA